MTKFNKTGYAMLQNITPATDVIGRVVKYREINDPYFEITSINSDCGSKNANRHFLNPIDDAVYFFKAMDILKLESMLIQNKDNFTHVSVEKQNQGEVYFLNSGEVTDPSVTMSNDVYAILGIDDLISIIDAMSDVKYMAKYFLASVKRDDIEREVELFKSKALEMHIVQCWAESYKSINSAFSYHIGKDGEVFFTREQARQLWDFWNRDKK